MCAATNYSWEITPTLRRFPRSVNLHRIGAEVGFVSRGFLRRDCGERGLALLDILAGAIRAAHLAFLVLAESQYPRKCFQASVAEGRCKQGDGALSLYPRFFNKSARVISNASSWAI